MSLKYGPWPFWNFSLWIHRTQPPSSDLTQPLSSKLKVLDENGLQIWAQLPLTNLWDIWIYVLHILLEGLVCPLTSPNLPPLSSPNLSITQLSEVRFWCSRCLNDRVDLLYMIGSFASGANVSLVAKNGTKQPWVKIENLCDFDRDFALFRGKIWL